MNYKTVHNTSLCKHVIFSPALAFLLHLDSMLSQFVTFSFRAALSALGEEPCQTTMTHIHQNNNSAPSCCLWVAAAQATGVY